MLQESDLSKSGRSSTDARARLEQAKHRYENLLLSVGPSMIADDLSASMSASKSQHNNANDKSHTHGHHYPQLSSSVDRSSNSLLFDLSHDIHDKNNRSMDRSLNGFDFHPFDTPKRQNNNDNNYHNDDNSTNNQHNNKDDTIILLQEENDRLRSQLEYLTASSEELLQEAGQINVQLVEKYETQLDTLTRQNIRLEESNVELNSMLRATKLELASERAQLQKALQLLDRFQRRSRDYLEVQRKAQHVVKQIDGMHYTAHLQNEHLQQLQLTQQQQQALLLHQQQQQQFQED